MSVTCLIATIKTIERLTNEIRLHRICKTAYPLFVWMSSNKKIFEYLESIACFDVADQFGEKFIGNPFTDARLQMHHLEHNMQNLYSTSITLARRLLGCGHRITHITSILFNGEVIFTAVSRKDPSGLNEYNYDKGVFSVPAQFCQSQQQNQAPVPLDLMKYSPGFQNVERKLKFPSMSELEKMFSLQPISA